MNFAQMSVDKVLYKRINADGTGAFVKKESTPQYKEVTLTDSLIANDNLIFIPKVSGTMGAKIKIKTYPESYIGSVEVNLVKKIYKNGVPIAEESTTAYLDRGQLYEFEFKEPILVDAFSQYSVSFEVIVTEDDEFLNSRRFDYNAEAYGYLSDKPEMYII